MAYTEIDSFVAKFKNLWHYGQKATLKVDSENGEAVVTLTAGLGHIPSPFSCNRNNEQTSRPYRGASYQRRQQRRKAAREVAGVKPSNDHTQVVAEEASVDPAHVVVEAIGGSQAEEAIEEAIENELRKENYENEAAEVPSLFKCEICDFSSVWLNGLNIHISRKHSTIEQLDGHNEDNSDDVKYRNTEHYWVRGWLGSVYQNYIDANELIESSEISEGAKIIEKDKLLDARKLAIGTNFKNLPPWNSVGKKKNRRNLLQDTESINNRRT